jgi:predicted amidohydrolase YtcJ
VLGGWHEEQWQGDRREFTLTELDAVTGRRPAFVMAGYDHALVNSAWLDAMRVPAGTETRGSGRGEGGIVALKPADRRLPRSGPTGRRPLGLPRPSSTASG